MRFGGLIAAIVVAAVAAFLVLRMGSGGAPAPVISSVSSAPQMQMVNVFVAARPIALGSKIMPDMVASQPWPEHLVLSGFIKADDGADKVIGTIARAPFQPQEPLLAANLANPNDPNFLAGELPKGMRVITILTNESEGLAGFVFPGDHVDVIMTHDVEKTLTSIDPMTLAPKQEKRMEPYTETLLNNVMVIAVDQRASGAGATDKDGKLIIPRSVSLMVSPTDAQRLRLGQKMGTLTLSLRSLADRDSVDPLTVTAPHDVSQVGPKDAQEFERGGASDVVVYRGVESTKTTVQSPFAQLMGAIAGASRGAAPASPSQAGRP